MSDFEFQLKGPEAIRARMESIRAQLQPQETLTPQSTSTEFQKQMDLTTKNGTPARMLGSIGTDGDEKLGTLPPLDPAQFEIMKGSIGSSGVQSEKVQVQALISQIAKEQNIDQNLLRAVVEAESDYNPNEVSGKGAMGLMQLMPGTAEELGVDNAFDPRQNLTGGAKYLKQMLNRYGGKTELALAAYNAGPGKVDAAKGIPNIPETKKYVNRIMAQLGRH